MMARRQFWLAVAAVAAALAVMDYLIHAVILAPDYVLIPGMWRPEHDVRQYMPYRIAGWLVFAVAFVWAYGKGMSMLGPGGQGLRYGFAVAAMCVVARHLVWLSVAPYPLWLVGKWLLFETLEILILAQIAAAVAAPRSARP